MKISKHILEFILEGEWCKYSKKILKTSDKLQEYLSMLKDGIDIFSPHYRYTSDNEYLKLLIKF